MNWRATRVAWCFLGALLPTGGQPAPQPARLLRVVLVAHPGGQTDRALTLLGVPHRTLDPPASVAELVAHDVIVFGPDLERRFNPADAATLADFVRSGGCILALEERSGSDGWLPVPVNKDSTFATSTIADATHPTITFPHKLTSTDVAQVHYASAYGPFYDLAPLWRGIISGTQMMGWEAQAGHTPKSRGTHWGLVEGEFGKGKILLCQLVPDEAWLVDAKGDDKCAGKRMFENLVDYALASAGVTRPFVQASKVARQVSPTVAVVCTTTRANIVSAPANVKVDGSLTEWATVVPAILSSDMQAGAAEGTGATGGKVWAMWGPRRFYTAARFTGIGERSLDVWLSGHCVGVRASGRTLGVTVDGKLARSAQVVARGDIVEVSVPRSLLPSAASSFQADGVLPFAVRLQGQLVWPVGLKEGDFTTYAVAVLTGPSGATSAGARIPTDSGNYAELRPTAIDNLAARVCEARRRLCAALTWTTSRPTSGEVEFGETAAYGSRACDDVAFANNHRVLLDHLQRGRTVHFRIVSETEAGAPVISGDRTFVVKLSQIRPGSVALARISLTVAEPVGVDRENAPVTSGVPFPKGALVSPDQVRLLNFKASELPLQTTVLARWNDGSIKWLLLDFQTTVAAGQKESFALEYGTAVTRRQERAIQITDRAKAMTVSSGPLSFSVNKQSESLFDEVLLNGQKVAGSGAFALRDNAGKEFSSSSGTKTVEVEEQGPMRVVIKVAGDHISADGGKLFSYLVRIHAYAGQPFVRVFYTFVNTRTEQPFTNIKEVRFRLPLNFGPGQRCAFAVDDQLREGKDEISLLQDFDNHVVVTGSSGISEGKRANGWLAIGDGQRGLTVAVRDFWQQYPKSVAVSPNLLTVGLCPPVNTDLYKDKEDAIYFCLRGGGYQFKSGLAKTHELFLSFGKGNVDGDRCRRDLEAFAQPLLATAPAEWYCDSKAFGEIAPSSPRFAQWDAFFDSGFKLDQHHTVTRSEYGLLNWGDWDFWEPGDYGALSNGKAWGNLEYDMPHSLLLQFARTLDRRYLNRAETAARHLGDVDVVHAGRDPMEVGQVYTHYYHHGETERARGLNGHSWLRGLLDYGFLTGDRRALEVGTEVGTMFARATTWNFDFDGTERVPGWPLIALMAMYRATNDGYYLNGARLLVDVVLRRQDVKRGAWTRELPFGHCDHTPHHTGGCGFMTGILLAGLKAFHEETGDPRVKQSIVRAADWLIEDLWVPEKKGFRYTSCPATSVSTSLIVLEALGYAYRLTGNPKYMDIGIATLHEGWKGTPGGCKGLAQATMSPPHFMYDVRDFERRLLRLTGPGRKTVLLLDKEDSAFSVTVYQNGAGGTATVASPRGKEVGRCTLTRRDSEYTFALGPDGLVGVYRVQLDPLPQSVWSVSSDLGKMAAAEANGRVWSPVKSQSFTYGQPIANAGSNKSLRLGEPPEMTFDGSRSVDYDGTIVRYEWDFGDGQKASGIRVTHHYTKSGTFAATLRVTDDEGLSDSAAVQVAVPSLPDLGLRDLDKRTVVIIEAESFAGQGNGEVRVMDKFAASGRAISYWEGPEQWVEWKLTVPKDGDYFLVARYATPSNAVRRLQVDGALPALELSSVTFPATGGFAGDRDDWRCLLVADQASRPVPLHFTADEHRLRLTHLESGLALDYLALVSLHLQ